MVALRKSLNFKETKFIECSQCPCLMMLTRSRFGLCYVCPCGEVHGANQQTGEALGIPADKETRQLRVKAHQIFDNWWKQKGLKRRRAYRQLALLLNLEQKDCHIAMFDKVQCLKLINILERL